MILNLVGRLSECALVAYRTPAESVRHLVPAGLELRTRGPWAYWSVLACRFEGLRPAGAPALQPLPHTCVSYRLHVQAMTDRIDVLRGLYVVRSETDLSLVTQLGHVLTDWRLHPATLRLNADGQHVEVTSSSADHGDARLVFADRAAISAPEVEVKAIGSSFPLPSKAAAWLAPPPLGLAVDGSQVRSTQVYRDEAAWRPRPVTLVEATLPYLAALGQTDLYPELALRLPGGDCRWRLGHRERLLQPGVMGVTDTLSAARRHSPRRRETVLLPSATEPVSV